MKQISKISSENREIQQLQSFIVDTLNPILRNCPILFGTTLPNVTLQIGSNSINTGLGYPLQGWFIVRKRGPGNIYDTQDSNPAPGTTLTLNSDAVVSVDILVF